MLKEEKLAPKFHDRAGFSSGVASLDDYLRRYVTQHDAKGIAVTRVLVDDGDPKRILGYYSLSAAQVEPEQFPEAARKGLPYHPVPCFRLSRLAVDRTFQSQGIGQVLLGLAVQRCQEAKKNVAAHALIVDAIDENAMAFYLHNGFLLFPDSNRFCYLPLGAAKKVADEKVVLATPDHL